MVVRVTGPSLAAGAGGIAPAGSARGKSCTGAPGAPVAPAGLSACLSGAGSGSSETTSPRSSTSAAASAADASSEASAPWLDAEGRCRATLYQDGSDGAFHGGDGLPVLLCSECAYVNGYAVDGPKPPGTCWLCRRLSGGLYYVYRRGHTGFIERPLLGVLPDTAPAEPDESTHRPGSRLSQLLPIEAAPGVAPSPSLEASPHWPPLRNPYTVEGDKKAGTFYARTPANFRWMTCDRCSHEAWLCWPGLDFCPSCGQKDLVRELK